MESAFMCLVIVALAAIAAVVAIVAIVFRQPFLAWFSRRGLHMKTGKSAEEESQGSDEVG